MQMTKERKDYVLSFKRGDTEIDLRVFFVFSEENDGRIKVTGFSNIQQAARTDSDVFKRQQKANARFCEKLVGALEKSLPEAISCNGSTSKETPYRHICSVSTTSAIPQLVQSAIADALKSICPDVTTEMVPLERAPDRSNPRCCQKELNQLVDAFMEEMPGADIDTVEHFMKLALETGMQMQANLDNPNPKQRAGRSI